MLNSVKNFTHRVKLGSKIKSFKSSPTCFKPHQSSSKVCTFLCQQKMRKRYNQGFGVEVWNQMKDFQNINHNTAILNMIGKDSKRSNRINKTDLWSQSSTSLKLLSICEQRVQRSARDAYMAYYSGPSIDRMSQNFFYIQHKLHNKRTLDKTYVFPKLLLPSSNSKLQEATFLQIWKQEPKKTKHSDVQVIRRNVF